MVKQRLAVQQGRVFLKHVLPAIIKPVHSLWHQVIGFLFFSFGIIFGLKAFHYYRDGMAVQFFVSAVCTLIMLGYGASSFLRARKISRS
jgi:sorbitol-specific phosphotransferase system component IIC